MKKLSQGIILMVVFLIWAMYVAFDAAYYKHMFKQSSHFVIDWQENSGDATRRGFKALSYFFDILLGVSGALIYLFSSARIKFYKLASYGIFSTYANVCVRMMYGEPRPFMVYDKLKIAECINDFGSPSGHLFTATTVYICLFHMYLIPWTQNRKTQKTAIATTGQPLYNDDIKSGGNYKFGIVPFFLWVLCILIIFAIGISRIYLGDHSYNQIVLGFVYGITFTIFVFILVDEAWGRFLQRLVERNWRQNKKALLVITAAFIVLIVGPIIIYEARKATLDYHPNWIRNISVKCGENNLHKMLLPYDFANSGIIALLFGGLYALALTSGYYTRKYKSEKLGFWQEILRIILIIVAAAPAMIVLVAVPWSAPYLNYFVGHLLCYFITFYALYGLLPYLYKWFKVERSGDLLRQTPIPAAPTGSVPGPSGAVAVSVGPHAGQAGRQDGSQPHGDVPATVEPRWAADSPRYPHPTRAHIQPSAPAVGPLVIAEPQVVGVQAPAGYYAPEVAAEQANIQQPRVSAIRIGEPQAVVAELQNAAEQQMPIAVGAV